MKWWKVFFLLPFGLISFWYESKGTEGDRKPRSRPKRKYDTGSWKRDREEIKRTIFQPVDDFMRDLFESQINRGDKIEIKGLEFRPYEFEVELIFHNNLRGSAYTQADFEFGRAKCRPGTYKAVRIRTPSLEVFRYTHLKPEDLREFIKEVTVPFKMEKTVQNNDTLTLHLPATTEGGLELGQFEFKWDVQR